GRGGRRSPPWAFTEHGAIMAATVLNSPQAVEMSVFVVRAFIRLRQFARGHAEITKRLDTLERAVAGHDVALKQMFASLRALLAPPKKHGRGIGFKSSEGES
ncbi:MAG: ORF6N domain-containing protein, partial [bacterium]